MSQITMQLYILRHGIAEDTKPGNSDENRSITPEGSRKLKQVLRMAEHADVFPAVVLSSPYLRARQTAEIAMDALGCREPLIESVSLVPDSNPENVWQDIRTHKNEEQVMLVGHEPLLSQLVAFLLSSPALVVDFKKGAMLRIDLDSFGGEPRGILKWMLAPRLAA